MAATKTLNGLQKLATTPTRPREVRQFFVHYNKSRPEWGPLDVMLIHMGGEIIPCPDGVVCQVPTRSEVRPEQPRIVMTGWCSSVVFDSKGAAHILP